MRHWSRLATRNWRARPVRTLGALLSIAIGTGTVVWVTCCYESFRAAVLAWSGEYVGASSITIESPLGKYDQLPQRMVASIGRVDEVKDVAVRLIQRLRAEPLRREDVARASQVRPTMAERVPEIDVHGVDLDREFKVRTYTVTAGRMLTSADERTCVLEESFAADCRVGVGDVLRLWTPESEAPVDLQIVGLLDRNRVGRFQKGMALVRLAVLQELTGKQALITSIDVVLHRGGLPEVRKAFNKIYPIAKRFAPNVNISSVESRMQQLERAQGQVELILTLLSCVAMLTALFIILSTLSMGMIERISQLGLLRCVGMSRWQLAWLILAEVFPLGAAGVALGVPGGVALAGATVWWFPAYAQSLAISWQGVAMAVLGGLLTTLLAAALPAAAALGVSPLEAAHPRARRASYVWFYAAGAAAALLLAVQFFVLGRLERSPTFARGASLAIVLLYLGYAAFGPLAVHFVGSRAVWVAGLLLGVRGRLLQDQVGRAVWRSTGICCGLMVGLSLIVGLVIFNESFRRGWDFPRNFPEAYVWNFEQITLPNVDQLIRETPGVGQFSAANAVNVMIKEQPLLMPGVFRSLTWFLGCDPDSFFELLKLEFIEGDAADALEKLRQGGHIIVAKDFAVARRVHRGDVVPIYLNRWHEFTVAAVVDSPALDIAAGWFQVQSEMHVAAVGSVIGSNADLRRLFDIEGVKLVLLNFDLPPEPVPAGWPPPRDAPQARGLAREVYDEARPLERRWELHRQHSVLRDIKQKMGASLAFSGTIRELKDEIDRELTRLTSLLAAVPAIALVVAAIGVANLMTANVASRVRQLAILRAVGATRGLVLRMVIGEALVLGLLGSAMGLALGVHLARDTALLTRTMYGLDFPFVMPWTYVGAAMGLTVALCLLAGVIPARHASRTNVVAALHSV
ncbi:MAG: hypothetical protein CHACPFDD_00071 [Phycisphaerae bacterium]|nr:hypothetical protein [Phycisphaerae bacterium]